MKASLKLVYIAAASVGLLVGVAARASSYTLIENDWDFTGTATGAVTPGGAFRYSGSGGGGTETETVILGPDGPTMPTIKMTSYGDEHTVSLTQIASMPYPTMYDFGGLATSTVLFTPDFDGTGSDIVFTAGNHTDGGGTVTIIDADNNAQLFQQRFGYNRGNRVFSFSYDSWSSDRRYLLIMQVELTESGAWEMAVSNNMQFTTPPASVPDTASSLALLGASLLGIACFRRRLAA